MALGFFKPVIFFPLNVLTGLSHKEIEAILVHELIHILRHDYIVNFFQIMLESLFFYHPSVWWISSKIRIQREMICDHGAVEFLQEPEFYVKTLVKTEESGLFNQAPVLAARGKENGLLIRIKSILSKPQKEAGISSWAHNMTIEIAKSKELPVPDKGFDDSLILELENEKIICQYHGAAHTLDNIVVWIPSESILFADCMVKSINSNNLGFTGDGDAEAYPETLKKVRTAYPDAKFVIPGHGPFGGVELVDHTLNMALEY